MIVRQKTKTIYVGTVGIGGDFPISIQSMTNTKTTDIDATVNQILNLTDAGVDIVRVSVPDLKSADAISEIVKLSPVPIIADIHFLYKLAIKSADAGVAGLRINPGNIGNLNAIKEVVASAKANNIPIRIGVNGGSLEKDLLKKYKEPCSDAMVESAVNQIKILEELGFYNIKISLKSSNTLMTIDAYQKISQIIDYPLHLGITEAGTMLSGTVKSSIGLGTLLLQGIGDTLRVSLSEDPIEEVKVGWEILKALNLRHRGIEIISCPTCARKGIDVGFIANTLEKRCTDIKKHIKICIMGCVVNGLGEAEHVDIGVVGLNLEKKISAVYYKGKKIGEFANDEILDRVEKLIRDLNNEG